MVFAAEEPDAVVLAVAVMSEDADPTASDKLDTVVTVISVTVTTSEPLPVPVLGETEAEPSVFSEVTTTVVFGDE